MALVAGTRLGAYEIRGQLGAGGMGEVYRARDTRLERTVAIKILNSQLTASAELRARFEREAKVISQLQHPHICVLHDVGSENGTDYLVMEYLEGESLSDKLKRGPLATNELLKIAVEIADALHKAHKAGIIHRDLKPGNVMLTKSGAKLLDFGLAKSMAASAAAAGSGSASVFAAAATMTSPASPLSSAGAVIGTVQYMSPEQIQGHEADARSDVFAFGVMLYEMATGKRAFEGKTQSSIVGQILAVDPPPISEVHPVSPAALSRLVKTCIAKDPDERFQTIHDVKLRLQEIADTPAQTNLQAAAPKSPLLLWTLAAIAVVALGATAIQFFSHPAAERTLRLAFVPPLNLEFNERYPDAAVISPDGSKVAFSAATPDGKWTLWVSSLDSSDVAQIPDSDNPLEPFWSPDSRSVAFGSQGKLKRADIGAGTSILCDAARMTGGSWSPNGVILFGSDYGSVLYQVPSGGGQPKAVTQKMDEGADNGHTSPWFFPDGKHFLFRININSSPRGLWVGSLDSQDRKQILTDNTGGIYAAGYLIFVRNQALVAQPFDTGSFELKGGPIPLVKQDAATNQYGAGIGRFSVSNNGVLVWQGTWKTQYQLRWFDRAGKALGNVGEVASVNSGEEPHLSPDGKQLLVKRDSNIWVLDLARGTDIRLTSLFSQLPLWMPNGREVIYQSSATNAPKRGIMRASANGVGQGELLSEGVKFPEDISPDGRYVTYMMRGEKTRLDVWVLPLFGDHKEYPLLNSQFEEREARFSPDGKWLAYGSDESGQPEVYVRPFTADGKLGDDKKRVSTSGGFQAVWNPNGKEIFYLSADYHLMSVSVTAKGGTLQLGTPKVLFGARTMSHYGLSHEYDVTPDGQKFLVGIAVGDARKPAPTVILNWTAELKK